MHFLQQFQKAYEISKAHEEEIKGSFANDKKLEIYSLYKQAAEGDNVEKRPGMFDLKAKFKWDAWTARKGQDQDTCKQQYVELIASYFSE